MTAARVAFAAVLAAAMPSVAFADSDSRAASRAVGDAAPGVLAQTELDVAPAGKRITRVEVDNPLGNVRVIGHDGPGLRITATKRAPDAATLARLRVSLTPDAAGPMRIITAVDPGKETRAVPRSQVQIDLVIEAPRDAWVDGRTGDGLLELINMDAGGELDSASGAVVVRNVSGPITAHTVDATLSLAEVFGIVEAGALAGDVTLDTIRGAAQRDVDAAVHRGDAHGAAGDQVALDVDVAAGRGEFEAAAAHPPAGDAAAVCGRHQPVAADRIERDVAGQVLVGVAAQLMNAQLPAEDDGKDEDDDEVEEVAAPAAPPPPDAIN